MGKNQGMHCTRDEVAGNAKNAEKKILGSRLRKSDPCQGQLNLKIDHFKMTFVSMCRLKNKSNQQATSKLTISNSIFGLYYDDYSKENWIPKENMVQFV